MANQESEDKYWKDELFFSSQDPLMREKEKRHHPDNGNRILIVQGKVGDLSAKKAVEEAAKKIQIETYIIYHPEWKISNN